MSGPTDAPSPAPGGVDPRVPRFNQGVTGLLLILAFLIDIPYLVPVLGLILGLGAVFGVRGNLWALAFVHAVRPVLRLGPPTKRKPAAPTRFAQALGAVFLAGATVALLVLAGPTAAIVGWGLTLAVAALALLAAATDICVGCVIYTLIAKTRRQPEPVEA